MGITGSDLTADLAQALDLNPNTRGVEVITVSEGSPAAEAGLQGRSPTRAGDIITAFDGQKVTGMADLRKLVSERKAGDVVRLLVIREGKEISAEVTLAEKK
jgi:S1-C subfamily serine protease